MRCLVIVESPAKCKKIESYLNDIDNLSINIYKVVATMGHITELKSLKNIDMENNFKCQYDLVESKRKNIETIRRFIKEYDEVILACDNDREGESINAHICDVFKLDIKKTKRIIFNEITQPALLYAINNPTTVNIDMVNAQKARQILDLLIGFRVSPVLWKYISSNPGLALSAGRCQTPALKIIYDNQQEINNTIERKVYNTIGYFTSLCLPFELNKKYETEDEMTDFLDGTSTFNHEYTCSKPRKVTKEQPEPFTTSRLQQVASNELHFSPKETMKICQSLYEGGYITYMRTDSKKYCREFIDYVKLYIKKNYDVKYINEKIDLLVTRERNSENGGQENEIEEKGGQNEGILKKKGRKTKSEKEETKKKGVNPQEAHEAIRPTNINMLILPDNLDNKEKRMYRLIWKNAIESCMSPALYHSITASIKAYDNGCFEYTSELIDFPGWKIVDKKYNTDNKEFQFLQMLYKEDRTNIIEYKKIQSKVTLKNTKSHYTEARLVQLLEEKGIGRPSTFSMLVDKIQERGYVKKQDIKGKEIACLDYELEGLDIFEIETKREFGNEKNKLVIQSLGVLVVEFLEKHFNGLFDYDYTKKMEDDLDVIAKGNKIWYELCKECNMDINTLIEKMEDYGAKKLDIKIDDKSSYVVGGYGPVIKTKEIVDNKEVTVYKSVKKDVDIHKMERGEYNIEELIEEKPTRYEIILGKYGDDDVILKKSKFGLYMTWGTNSKTLKELGNRPMESIKYQDVLKFLEDGGNFLREITESISIRKSKRGDYIFFKTPKMKKPSFFALKGFTEDYMNCDISVIKSWIKDTYKIF